MAITYLSGQRVQGSSTGVGPDTVVTITADTGEEDAMSTGDVLRMAQIFEAGHTLIDKTVKSLTVNLRVTGSPEGDLTVKLIDSSANEKADFGTLDVSTLNGTFATKTFTFVSATTNNIIQANDKITLGWTPAGTSSPTVRWQLCSSCAIDDTFAQYSMSSSGTSWSDRSTSATMTVTYEGTQDDKTTVTDVPTGSQFEETDTRKFYQRGDLTADLKAFWTLSEAGSTLDNTATGSADLGTAADLTVTGNPAQNQSGSPSGLANNIQLDGTGDYLTAGSSTSQFNFMHNTSAKFTVSFWCRAGSGDIPDNSPFFNTAHVDTTIGVKAYKDDTDKFKAAIYRASENNEVFGPAASTSGFFKDDDEWHHYVWTYDQSLASANAIYYRDGGNAETFNKEGNTPEDGDAAAALRIGADAGTGSDTMNADLVSFAIWNRVLTADEVSVLYASGNGVPAITAGRWVERGTAI